MSPLKPDARLVARMEYQMQERKGPTVCENRV